MEESSWGIFFLFSYNQSLQPHTKNTLFWEVIGPVKEVEEKAS